jgi:methionyl-tRNA synthetase
MYLTAANNLSMYKNLLITKNHRPHKLFVKEGVEMQYNDRQSLDNYKDLLKTLFDLLKRNGSKKTEDTVEDFDEQEEARIEEIISNLKKYEDSQRENINLRSKFETYSKIIVDTNVFVNDEKPLKTYKILLNNKDKLLVHIVVKKELELLRKHQDGLKSQMASFYLEFIDTHKIEVFKDPKIDFKTMGEEFADKHLVNFTKYYLNQNQNQKILFVSNDMKPNPPGPYYELKKYNLRNLIVWNHNNFINQSNSR